jgi:hypothetical protein
MGGEPVSPYRVCACTSSICCCEDKEVKPWCWLVARVGLLQHVPPGTGCSLARKPVTELQVPCWPVPWPVSCNSWAGHVVHLRPELSQLPQLRKSSLNCVIQLAASGLHTPNSMWVCTCVCTQDSPSNATAPLSTATTSPQHLPHRFMPSFCSRSPSCPPLPLLLPPAGLTFERYAAGTCQQTTQNTHSGTSVSGLSVGHG